MFRIVGTILIIILAVLATIFSVMNANPVELNYYLGKVEIPLSMALVLSLVVGALMGVMASLGVVIRLKKENIRLKKENANTEKELMNLRKLPLKE